MDSMICYSCVLKHLSAALSFGKEVLSGHSKGDELDHRIDFIGEVTNAEQHLELIDKNLFGEISLFRKTVQEKDVLIDVTDLEFIRQMYLKVEMSKDGLNKMGTPEPLIDDPDVVYLDVKNKDFFDLSYRLLSTHLMNYKRIYVLKSNIDLSEYSNVIVLNEDLREFMKRTDISTAVLILSENMGILKDIDAKYIFPTFTNKFNPEIMKEIKPNPEEKVVFYDDIKIQPINVKKFNDVIKDQKYTHYLTPYFYYSEESSAINDVQISVNVDRPVCCSIKTGLKLKSFCRWNEVALESLKKELGI